MQMTPEQPRPAYAGRAFTAATSLDEYGKERFDPPAEPIGFTIALLANEVGAQVVLDRACEILAYPSRVMAATPVNDQAREDLRARLEQAEQERDATLNKLDDALTALRAMTAERDQWRTDYAETVRAIASKAVSDKGTTS